MITFSVKMNVYIIYFLSFLSVSVSMNYYELLGISKDADNREIRKAFKKLALKLHPDKIKDHDEKGEGHEKFIAINKAYEVLKDEQMRKKYDLYGEEGLKEDFGSTWKGNYHSWNYYSESFGIYDDDLEITTLNKQDFMQLVSESSDVWFVNFYSPQCSHCHDLAPAWRELSRELQNVIHVGAVNCEEDWVLCRQQNVYSYPYLILYPKTEKYQGSRDSDSMIAYVLQRLPDLVKYLRYDNFSDLLLKKYSQKPWLIFSCQDSKGCYERNELKKLAIILDNLVNVAVIKEPESKICEKISCESQISYYKQLNSSEFNVNFQDLSSVDLDLRALIKQVFEILPNPEEISESDLKGLIGSEINNRLSSSLIQFTKSETADIEMKRLKANLPEISIGWFNCDKYPILCSSLYVKKFPTYILFKEKGFYEFYHGKITVHGLVHFTKEALISQVQTLTPENFPAVIESGENWFIDFFAPWCPPCMELLPQWRKISQTIGVSIKFGTVDCAAHVSLCRQYNINSYPTTILYNQSIPFKYSGFHSHNQIKDFIQDILHPYVVSLSPSSFETLVHYRKQNEIWVIDYFAPWCGPCQQLAPQWRKLAKMMQNETNVYIGEVNCQVHSSICDRMGVNRYPTIHLYPSNSLGTENFFKYNENSRDAAFLQGWIYNFLPSKVLTLTDSTYKTVLSDNKLWLVDFFAPWCSHCQIFAPEFQKLSQVFDGRVKFGKVNCDHYPNTCRMAGVKAYPTVLFYKGSKEHVTQDPYGVELKNLTYEDLYSFLDFRVGHKPIQRKSKVEL